MAELFCYLFWLLPFCFQLVRELYMLNRLVCFLLALRSKASSPALAPLPTFGAPLNMVAMSATLGMWRRQKRALWITTCTELPRTPSDLSVA